MYLTISQQDQLRNIVSNFEIPYRSFVIDTIISVARTKEQFNQHIQQNATMLSSLNSLNHFIERFNKFKKEYSRIFDIFQINQQTFLNKRIEGDLNVPNVSDLNISIVIFKDLFPDLLLRYNSLETFWNQEEQYRYIRNRLDHPGSINFEQTEVDVVLDFISNVCSFLDSFDSKYFWQESYSNINKKITNLKNYSYELPLEKHNLNTIPSSDIHVVCRENEIADIKEFVYGKKGALRKKSSYCIYGYGGVGKTALVLESIKQIVQDILEGQTINSYSPSYILFYSAKKEYLDIIRAQAQVNLGGTISPFNAWLIMRGSVTLPLRMKQHNENALKIAKWLEERPGVSFVSYPGLESHPQHEIALRQMAPGFGGVLTFGLKADHETHNRFVSHLRVITNAVSLGHDASLIVFLGENDERQHLYPERFHNGFFRFSVGIEDADDLIEDLRQALEKVGL